MSMPQWVKIARATPASAHQSICVSTDRVSDHGAVLPALDRASNACSIADVERDAGEHPVAIKDVQNVRHVEHHGLPPADAITNGWRAKRMVDRHRFEFEAADGDGLVRYENRS